MSSSVVKNSCSSSDKYIYLFDWVVRELVEQIGLKKRVAFQFQNWFVKANEDQSIPEIERKNLFVDRFTPYMEKEGGPILDRSCFFRAPISEKQVGADTIHYVCLRAVDEIYDDRDELYFKWIDGLYDQGVLSATQALLIAALMNQALLSLMEKEHDEGDFSSLLENVLERRLPAEFAREMRLLKGKIPIRDSEIVLFTEVVYILNNIRGIERRALFQDFLECFIEASRGCNSEVKKIYFSIAEGSLAEKNEISRKALALKTIPRIKLAADKYWFLRIFDQVSKCRSSFAKFVDALLDEGHITFSAANEFLELNESPRTWNHFNAAQEFLRIQKRYNLNLDLEEFLDVFLGFSER